MKITIYSHTPGFRRWGRTWGHEAETVAVLEELGRQGRKRKGCDFVITKAEYKAVEKLAEHPAFPLCLTDGEPVAKSAKAEAKERRRELDDLARATAELKAEREKLERELAELDELRQVQERELAELRDATKSAEEHALAAEAKAEKK